jgi:pyruvate dehydrogenase E1 component
MENDSDTKVLGMDPQEIQEWVESFDEVVREEGQESAITLLDRLRGHAQSLGIALPFTANTPYINTIPLEKQPIFPGDQEIERSIKSLMRWNALAMVVRANRVDHSIGGHISTYASAATLFEVGFNHFFRGRTEEFEGDTVYLPGPCFPWRLCARVFGRPPVGEAIGKFPPRAARGRRVSSYPHPGSCLTSGNFPRCRWALARSWPFTRLASIAISKTAA